MALDGKIYIPEPGLSSLGVINNPNALGTLCNYSLSAVSLGTVNIPVSTPVWAKSSSGLPNFISNYFEQKPAIPPLTGTVTCGNASFSMPSIKCLCA